MVCDEYLDVINAVVRDAYHYTYPRAITADGYIRPLKRSEAPPSYDEAWRQQVMERAFKRMVDKVASYLCFGVLPGFYANLVCTIGQDLDEQTNGVEAASRLRRETILQGPGQRRLGLADLLDIHTGATSIQGSSAES
jgi:hypothetical protein